ncbi:MAG: hypothetical protein JWO20_1235 [Candidatus Angelobacter sp.]|nr:hypothetical protein [Candidatus Angelobacter sp.]
MESRMRSVKTVLIFLVFAASLSQIAAQQKTTPVAATEDISGMYSFEHDGEFVQITIEPGKSEDAGKPIVVSGFISRFGDLDSDRGTFLDHFFSKGALQDHKLTFTTKTVHGIWFEFSGAVERGDAKTRASEGYFVLKGTLKENTIAADKSVSSRSREMRMKSFPNLDDDQVQK